jgi:hypothetical protein
LFTRIENRVDFDCCSRRRHGVSAEVPVERGQDGVLQAISNIGLPAARFSFAAAKRRATYSFPTAVNSMVRKSEGELRRRGNRAILPLCSCAQWHNGTDASN